MFDGNKNMTTNHYVYAVFHPDTGLTCWIGISNADSWCPGARTELRNALGTERCGRGWRRFIFMTKLREGLTKSEAKRIETDLITQIGRKVDGGPLLNKSFGSGSKGCSETVSRATKLHWAKPGGKEHLAAIASKGRDTRNRILAGEFGEERAAEMRARVGCKPGGKRTPEQRENMTVDGRARLRTARVAAQTKGVV